MKTGANPGPPQKAMRALRSVGRHHPWLVWLLMWFLLFVMYFITAPGNRTEADDAFWFACEVDRGGLRDQLLGHIAHLLYLPVMSGIHQALDWLSIRLSTYDLLRLLSNLAAPSAALAFFAVAKNRFRISSNAALASTAGLCVSYGFWRYANEAEVYTLAAALTLAALWFAFGATSSIRVLAVAGLAIAATFIHILSVIPALTLMPFLVARANGIGRVGLYVGSYLALFFAVTYGAFAYVGADQSYVAFVRPPPPDVSFRAGAPQTVMGFGPSLVAGNFLLTYTPVLDLIDSHTSKALEEERFLAERLSVGMKVAPLITGAALLVLLTLLLVSFRRPRGTPRSPSKRDTLALLFVWIVGHWFVVVRVNPGAPEAWIPVLLPVWFAVGIFVFDRARSASQTRMIWLVVVALALHNYVGGLLLMRDASDDYNARRAAWLVSHTGPDDVILTITGPVPTRYLAYRSSASVVTLWAVSPGAVRSIYARALTTPGDVYVMGDVFDPPDQIRLGDPALYAQIRELTDDLGDQVRRVSNDPSAGGVYVLTRKDDRDFGAAEPLQVDTCPDS
jgi:hypothetical protein